MMKTELNKQEHVSALLDGELPDAECDALIAGLSGAEGRKAWDMYHRIGDVLRSDDLAVELSADFSSRFSALLEAEPVVLAPKPRPVHEHPEAPAATVSGAPLAKPRFSWNVAIASMAAAAAVAFVMAPQVTAMFGTGAGVQLAAGDADRSGVQQNSRQNDAVQLVADAGTTDALPSQSRPADEPEMLRDPRIDSYLLAHQRFSPAISNAAQTTQYATRATSSDSDK